MATKLNKKSRDAFLEKALRAGFAHRFDAIKQRVTALGAIAVQAQHPKFVALMTDKEARQYLAISSSLLAKQEDVPLRYPGDYVLCKVDDYAERYTYIGDRLCNMHAAVDYPSYQSTKLEVTDADLLSEYHALWADFIGAQQTLRDTIYAYDTVEKFSADFPNLTKYLPPTVTTPKTTAVAVRVGDVLTRLAAVGIPPETTV